MNNSFKYLMRDLIPSKQGIVEMRAKWSECMYVCTIYIQMIESVVDRDFPGAKLY